MSKNYTDGERRPIKKELTRLNTAQILRQMEQKKCLGQYGVEKLEKLAKENSQANKGKVKHTSYRSHSSKLCVKLAKKQSGGCTKKVFSKICFVSLKLTKIESDSFNGFLSKLTSTILSNK